MHLTLDNLSGNSFERLIRAMCLKAFGASATVFGSGPDGGRDLTLAGRIPGYEPRSWDGYLVVQAKYREPSSKAVNDTEWLLSHLAAEKERYLDQSSGRRIPQYYIIATNISLSGADGKGRGSDIRRGGHTKISDFMETWKTDLGLVDYDIWPLDKITDMLAADPETRQTFAAWITPGDILSEMFNFFRFSRPDFREVLRRSLITSLRRKQFAELKDAGSVADPDVRASQVFIDVPVTTGDSARQKTARNVLDSLIRRSKEKLDPETIESTARQYRFRRNKIVLLGGPGQGKSTVSTMLSQIFRAHLLTNDPVAIRDDTIKSLSPEIIQRAKNEGINSDIPARFPIFVSLPVYADRITACRNSKEKLPSLLLHIAEELGESSDISVEKADVRLWLGCYPWVVILDGLDEVPPSGERDAIIEAINAFSSEVNSVSGDVLFILTTRPQGYNDDLDPNLWEHWELSELPPERALAYAAALGEARYPDDERRREKVLKSLESAAVAPATSRLMVTPLQVTILYLIVDTGGSAPAARWTLFNEYFEVLKRREKSKGGLIQSVIENNLAHIGPIHQAAGLVLQVKSEVDGGAASRLSSEEFKSLASSYFLNQGYNALESSSRADELTTLALNRLVLLSAKEEGRIRFDVRSLQEFMAAAALTAGEMGVVEHRLEHIAGIAHWRHVWLIAASRCFSEDGFHHRRPAIIGIPRTLDEEPTDRLVQNGARLALELFMDGLGSDHPRTRLALARHAMSSLSAGEEIVGGQLAGVWEKGTEEIVEEALRNELSRADMAGSRAAWNTLFEIDEPGIVGRLVKSFWPSDIRRKRAVMRRVKRLPHGHNISPQILDGFSAFGAAEGLD